MAAIANVTVKKADTTTDIVYDALVGAAGDLSPAMYRQDTGAAASKPQGLRARFNFATKWNGPRTARVGTLEYVAPYATQDTTTSKWSATDQVVIRTVVTMPQAIPASEIQEAVTQGMQLIGHGTIRTAMWSGFAPT